MAHKGGRSSVFFLFAVFALVLAAFERIATGKSLTASIPSLLHSPDSGTPAAIVSSAAARVAVVRHTPEEAQAHRHPAHPHSHPHLHFHQPQRLHLPLLPPSLLPPGPLSIPRAHAHAIRHLPQHQSQCQSGWWAQASGCPRTGPAGSCLGHCLLAPRKRQRMGRCHCHRQCQWQLRRLVVAAPLQPLLPLLLPGCP